MDDELRPAIDRLISAGGRSTIHGSTAGDAVVVTLDQPGNRFGILEVHGRLDVGATHPGVATLLEAGWSDPTVTQRLGREVRLRSREGDDPIVLTRTWRVPPALASEIVAEVRAAVGTIDDIDTQGLATRGRDASHPAAAAVQTPSVAELDEVSDTDPGRRYPPPARQQTGRSVPAPMRLIGAAVLVIALAVVWASLIRGSPRSVAGATARPTLLAAASVVPSATPTPTPTPVASLAPLGVHLVSASTESDSGPADAAVDGDPVTAWHAAFGVPQWIEIGLDTPGTVHQVVLLIAQAEAGTTKHMIQVAQANGVYQVVGIVERLTDDGETILFRPATPLENVDRIRIETMASPSNAGWYEVIVR